jgi:hypothetical protein
MEDEMTDVELQTAIDQQSTTATGAPATPTPPVDPPEGYEFKTATGQVYKGKTKDEVIAQMIKAQENATIHIKQQHDRLKDFEARAIQAPVAAPVNGGFQKAEYFKLLEEDPLKAQDYLDSYRPMVSRVLSTVDKMEYGFQAQEFLRAVPDYEDLPENADRIRTRLAAEQKPLTADNMRLAYYSLLGEGVIKKNAQAAEQNPGPRVPPVLGGAGAGPTDEIGNIESETANMDDKQFAEYLRKKGVQFV